MTIARENISLPIISSDYQIAGNTLRAFYDVNDNLVFVIDSTISENKPHALLVMMSYGNRKWDDILSNDFQINLETIRPKVDNKYQKLDIDYTGLEIYDDLITKFKSGDDIDLSGLQNFRIESVRRSATERLNTAMTTINTARETIDKANMSLSDLNNRLSELRAKLAKQRASVGREPTKQSASKILRTESQIDATVAKISRSQKRIANAQKRLANAESDADMARKLLNIQNQIHEPKAEIMADTDVKPLFDKDPEILDDNIAFKPIEFGATSVKPEKTAVLSSQTSASETKPGLNLSFVPPLSVPEQTENNYPEESKLDETFTTPAPILENINPVPGVETEMTPVVGSTPVMDSLRPSSPNVSDLGVVQQQTSQQHIRPNTLYYMLLVILIVLSIFTLWLYQKSVNTTIPELLVNTSAQEQVAAPVFEETAQVDDELPVIIASPDVVVPTSVATVDTPIEPVVTNEPNLEIVEPIVSEPEPVEQIAEPEPENVVSEPADDDTDMCSDGNAPDKNGCCDGEIFTTLDDGVACCAADECYPPMK